MGLSGWWPHGAALCVLPALCLVTLDRGWTGWSAFLFVGQCCEDEHCGVLMCLLSHLLWNVGSLKRGMRDAWRPPQEAAL